MYGTSSYVSGVSKRLAVLIGVLLLTTSALAHAILVDSAPATDSVIVGPDLNITLKFNVRIDAVRSKVILLSPEGKRQTLHAKAGAQANVLSSQVTGIAPGKYKLVWQVLASDGHISSGEIDFSAK